MPDGLVPINPEASPLAGYQAQDGPGDPGAPTGPAKNPLERPIAAMRRYKWLMLGIASLSTLLGVVALRYLTQQYEVRATIWLQTETPQDQQNRAGPIRSGEMLSGTAWIQLFKSYRVVDAVVRKLALYLKPEKPFDAPFFRGFTLAERFAPGEYQLVIDAVAKKWVLQLKSGAEVDHGSVRDSVGRALGFRWQLPSAAFARGGTHRVAFTVLQPREASMDLLGRLGTSLPEGSNFLSLTYTDPDPGLAAQTLNTWLAEFVEVAGDIKKRNMVEFSKILARQLEYASANLVTAQSDLETFRIQTITLPADAGPAAAGVELTRDPVLRSFFEQRAEFDNLRHDREAFEKALAAAQAGTVQYEAVLAIPSVEHNPGSAALKDAFAQLYRIKEELRTKQHTFTDSVKEVMTLSARANELQNEIIPAVANQILRQLREREGDYQTRIAGAAKELRAIPPRTIEEMARTRAVKVAEGLYIQLKGRHAEAQLAEASATPDVNIHDPAVAPSRPAKNTASRIMLLAVVGGVGAAIGLAILLDKLDGRFRYPDQATSELGLRIAGIVPRLPKGGVNPNSPEQVMSLIESFRSLRMHVMHSVSNPACLAVSSAAPSDGKSLVASNLAMSFAEAGLRTVLVDGDTRRGALHELFGATNLPGLTEFLVGTANFPEVVQPTSHENLSIIACGRRNTRSPELLSTGRLTALVNALRRSYDVIIFDTPPLAAGIDGYAISAATGNLLMVVRIGKTERRLAAAKLTVADRLPIHLIGTVLNGVDLRGEFQYYGYSSGYSIEVPKGELVASG